MFSLNILQRRIFSYVTIYFIILCMNYIVVQMFEREREEMGHTMSDKSH